MYQFDTSNLRDFGLPRPRASTIARLNEKLRREREAAEREAAARAGEIARRIRKQFALAHDLADECMALHCSLDEPPTLARILYHVSGKHGITVLDLKSHRRTKRVCHARHEFCWFARHYTTRSLPEIGRFLGDKDHTTVLHGVRRHQARIDAGEVEADRTFER